MIEYLKTQRSINLKIGTYLRHWVLVTWPNFGISMSKVYVAGAHDVYR